MIDLVPLGDRAWLARFADESDARLWVAAVKARAIAGVSDVVLAYATAAVHHEPGAGPAVESALRSLRVRSADARSGRLVSIPVLYDGDDLDEVASMTGLSVEAAIEAHSSPVYDVFAIGFQPGFPYAGYLASPLDAVPRRREPRLRVASGSVAIAARQTGIYPAELPGGWHLLGRTPLAIVDVAADWFPIRAGDRLKFVPIDEDEYVARRGERLS